MSMSRLAAAAALLCSTSLANAAPTVLSQMDVSLFVAGSVILGPELSDERDFKSTGMFVPVPPGAQAGFKVDLVWDKQIDQLPGGGGSERSAGFVYAETATSYTIKAPANGPWSLTSDARVDTAAQWTTQDGNGEVTTPQGTLQGDISTTLLLELAQAATARLSGMLFLPNSGSTWNAVIHMAGSGTSQGPWLITNGSQGFEAEWALQPGVYRLDANVSDFEISLPCCNIAYGGSGGWTYTLEIDSLAPVPEPASLGLLLAGLAVLRQRIRQAV